MKKKLFSILLSLAMVVTMMPAMAMTAFASGHDLKVQKLDNDGTTVIDAIESVDYSWDGNNLVIPQNGLIVTGTTSTDHILVASDVTELTLKDVNIIPTAEMETGILIEEGAVGTTDANKICKITLIDENQIGNAVTYTETTKDFDYKVKTGIASSGSITFTGKGNLTIFDQIEGIKAANVTFDESLAGTVKIEDFGYENCAIRAESYRDDSEGDYVGGNVSLLGGTFNLTSYKSKGIYAEGNVNVKNANLTVVARNDAICADYVDDGDYISGAEVTISDSSVDLVSSKQDGIDADGNIKIEKTQLSIHSYNESVKSSNLNVTIMDCSEMISLTADDDEVIDASQTVSILNCTNAKLLAKEDDVIYAGDIVITNSTMDVTAEDGNDGLDADTDRDGEGSVTINGGSKATIHAEDNGIECYSLSIQGPETEVYSVGDTDKNGNGCGVEINGTEEDIQITDSSVKFTGDEAAILFIQYDAEADPFTGRLNGIEFLGNTEYDTFNNLKPVTFESKNEDSPYELLPYIEKDIAKSVAIVKPEPKPYIPTNEDRFRAYKVEQATKLDKLAEEVTSDSDTAIVATAKADLEVLKYDSTKTLAENKASARSIVEAAFVHVDKIVLTKVKAYKNGKIKVSWKALTLKDNWKVDTYQVYRKVGKNGKYKLLRTVKLGKKSTITIKNTKKLKKGKKYYYKVRGKNLLSDGTYAYTKWSKVKSVKCKKTRR